MDMSRIAALLQQVRSGKLTIDKATEALKHLPYEDIHFAKVDHHRHMRQGIPEVVYAEGKSTDEAVKIARALYEKGGRVLISRASKDIHRKLKLGRKAHFHERSGMISVGGSADEAGQVLVLSAGTSDIPVAEEVAVTARFMGSKVEAVYDVGVAGIHRVMDQRGLISGSRVVVVVAGMEGALPSVVGGLTDRPIIAVPTSVGYGTSFGGLTALLGMLNSCVPGIAVMNIDNGFGAGCLAHKINTLSHAPK